MENITKTFAARRFFGKTVDRDKTECYDAYKKRNHVGVVGEIATRVTKNKRSIYHTAMERRIVFEDI